MFFFSEINNEWFWVGIVFNDSKASRKFRIHLLKSILLVFLLIVRYLSLLPGLLSCTCTLKNLIILRVHYSLSFSAEKRTIGYWLPLRSFGDYCPVQFSGVMKCRAHLQATRSFEVFSLISPLLEPWLSPSYIIYRENFT